MPRSQSKSKMRKKSPSRRGRVAEIADNDDAASDITHLSLDDEDANSVYAESVVTTTQDPMACDILEEKIKEALDNASNKNSSVRLEALKTLHSALVSNYAPEFLANWKITTADVVERCMRYKKGSEECKKSIKLGVLLAVQLGTDCCDSLTKFFSYLKEWVNDPTLNSDFRAECVTALSLFTYLAEEELETIVSVLNCLRDIWVRTKVNSPPEFSVLYCACVNAWSLLLLHLPNNYLNLALTQDLPHLCEHLENSQMEVRIASGETLCVLYELARESRGNGFEDASSFKPPSHHRTIELLEQMSHDSVKYQAKRDRRVQRASFRDIYAAIKDNDAPDVKVKFGAENLILDSWSSKLCYNIFCNFLHGGIVCHLRENLILREIFGLGAPVANMPKTKISKLERQIMNQSITKARSLLRGKQRDKRTAVFT